VPAFLLSYHSGWKGAATALAAGMALLTLAQIVTIMGGNRVENWPMLLSIVTAYITISLGIGFLSEQLHQQRTIAERLAHTDELTGAPNRRFADIFIEKEFAAAQRGRSLTIVLFDLDHFKAHNDRYGHPAADETLRAFAEILLARTRLSNLSGPLRGQARRARHRSRLRRRVGIPPQGSLSGGSRRDVIRSAGRAIPPRGVRGEASQDGEAGTSSSR